MLRTAFTFVLLLLSFNAQAATSVSVPADLVKASDNVVERAVLKRAVTPEYPEEALEEGQSGEVVVGFIISPSGRIVLPQILHSQPQGVFEKAVFKVLNFWEFQPADGASSCISPTQGAYATFTFNAKKEEKKVTVTALALLRNRNPAHKHADSDDSEAGYLPVPIRRTQPEYPRKAARSGLEGIVTVSFTILTDGSTGNFEVMYSAPKGFFEKATLNALENWKFEPIIENGKAVKFEACQTLIYKLPDQFKYRQIYY